MFSMKIQLLTDPVILVIEKGIRGGICHVIQRYATYS